MVEIEVKARLSDAARVRTQLEQLGCQFGAELRQEDTIFLEPNKLLTRLGPGAIVLRLRKQEGRTLLTLKQHRSNELDCLEHETSVGDAEAAAAIIATLGYRKVTEVKKHRRIAKYHDISICMDSVDGLGDFIEVESLAADASDGDRVQAELFSFLLSLGVRQEDRVLIGYDTLMVTSIGQE